MKLPVLSNRAALVWLWALIIAQCIVTTSYNLTHLYELKKSGMDGAAYLQLLFNTLQGHGLTTTLHAPYEPQHWFAIHFSPILYALLPAYAIFPRIETLVLIHTTMLALAAWPVFLCARRICGSSMQALCVGIMYLVSPYVVNAAIWDFHEVAFAPLCIATMLYAVLARSRWLLLAGGVVLLCLKEHYGLALVGFGLLWAWYWKDYRFGLGVAATGMAALVLILSVLMPHFSPTDAPAMMNADSTIDRFSWLAQPFAGDTPLAALVFGALFYASDLLYPLLFLPLRSFLWLLPAAADMAANALGDSQMMKSVASYHSAALIPVMLAAFCHAAAKPFARFPHIHRRDVLAVALAVTLYSAYHNSLLPVNPQSNLWEFSTPRLDYTPEDKKALESISRLIEPDAAVSAQDNALPHLKPRHKMYHFPEQVGDADYIVLHTGFPYQGRQQVFGSPYSVRGEIYFAAAKQWLDDPQWGIAFYEHDWLVLKKSAVSDKAALAAALSRLEQTQTHYASLAGK